jgi:hypothetical protein
MAERGGVTAGRPMTLLWMVLALVIVGGFLTWLNMASEPTTVAVVESNDDENGTVIPMPAPLTVVEREALGAASVGTWGSRCVCSGVEATGRLGARIFWGELGDPGRQIPILVRLDTAQAGRSRSSRAWGTPSRAWSARSRKRS